MKRLLVVISVVTLSLFSTLIFSDESKYASCPSVRQANDELSKWIHSAIQGKLSIGCPSVSDKSPLTNLEKISRNDETCGKEAAAALFAFYAMFAHHSNYKMCGLIEKEDLLLAKYAVDTKMCANQTAEKMSACFNNMVIVISRLKERGEIQSAFELARKTANSGDTTGLSQMILATMTAFGEGTEKDMPTAIKWYKIALQKIDDRETRIDVLMSLSVAYEDLKDNTNALIYMKRCAALGDPYCKKGLERLATHSTR